MSADYTPERAAKLVDNIIQLQADRDEIIEAIENQKRKLAELYDNQPGEFVEDGRKIMTYFGKRIDEAYAKKNEPELYKKALVTKEVFNAAGAKAALTEEEYARVQKVNDKITVVVDLVED